MEQDPALFSDQPVQHDAALFSDEPAPQTQSPIESAARGALRNFPLAQQAAAAAAPVLNQAGLADKPDYSGELQHLTEAAEQGKAQNPKSYYTGAIAGSLAPMAIPVVGEALESAPIASNAALGAAQAVSDTSMTKDPMKAAGQAALGAGTGAATAALLGKILPTAPTIETAANKSAVKSAMLNRNFLGHLDPDEVSDLGDFMTEHGLVNRNTQDALEQTKIIRDAYGNMIDQIGADAQRLKNPKGYISQLAEKAERYADRADPEFKKMANTYGYAIEELKGMGKQPTFAQLQELKSVYGDHAFNADHTVANKAAADVYFTLKDAMNHIIKTSPDEYAGALKGWSYSNEILNGLTKKLGTERAGSQGIGMGSISRVVRQLPAPVRAAAGAGAALAGHPYVAGMAALPEIMNPALHSQALTGLSKASPQLNNAAKVELTNALEALYGKKGK